MDHGSFPIACLYYILYLWARWLKSHYAPRTSLKMSRIWTLKAFKLTLRISVTPLCNTFSEVSPSLIRQCTSYEVHGDTSNWIGMDGWKTLNWKLMITTSYLACSSLFILVFKYAAAVSNLLRLSINTSHGWLGRRIAYLSLDPERV